jgi:hypothetical protein
MSRTIRSRAARLVLGCLLGFFTFSGCANKKLVAVSGKATVDGVPLTKAVVFFAPDKDNPLKTVPRGRLDENGAYQLETDGAPGVPVGWYRAYIAFESGKQVTGNPSPFLQTIDPKYLSAGKSPLAFEVVADPQPNVYDLRMTKRPKRR